MTPNKRTDVVHVAVGAFIINAQGQILLGLRKGVVGAGDRQVPGGHLEYGESLIDAARREIKEETGLTVGEMRLISVIDETPGTLSTPLSHYVTIDFEAQYLGGEPRVMEPHKCAEWRWFSFDQLPAEMSKGMRTAIQNYRAKLVYSTRATQSS